MAIFEDISKALIGILADNDFNMPVVYENEAAESVKKGGEFLEMFELPAFTEQSSLGDKGCDYHEGILQIDINMKAYEGTAALKKKADEINAIIKSGATFTNNSQNVRIGNVSIERVTISDGLATLPMSIEYWAYTERV